MFTDPRITKLAEMLIQNAVQLKEGDNILIETIDTPSALAVELIKAVYAAKGNPFLKHTDSRVQRERLLGVSEKALQEEADLDLIQMKQMQAYIAIRGSENSLEMSDVPAEKMAVYRKIRKEVLNWRVNKTRWCILRWPNPSMAQSAGMSTEAFENFYFKACLADYPAMSKAEQSAH